MEVRNNVRNCSIDKKLLFSRLIVLALSGESGLTSAARSVSDRRGSFNQLAELDTALYHLRKRPPAPSWNTASPNFPTRFTGPDFLNNLVVECPSDELPSRTFHSKTLKTEHRPVDKSDARCRQHVNAFAIPWLRSALALKFNVLLQREVADRPFRGSPPPSFRPLVTRHLALAGVRVGTGAGLLTV